MNVYMSLRKSMTVRTYIHLSLKRAETTALLDSGATENFMSLTYAKWLKLPIKTLRYPRPLFNVDGSTNKQGDLKFYTDLLMRTGTTTKKMRFFLSNLGNHQVILGYPWFAAFQPKIDWAKGWIDVSQLPLMITDPDAPKTKLVRRPTLVMTSQPPHNSEKDFPIYAVQVSFPATRFSEEDHQNLQKNTAGISTSRTSILGVSSTKIPRTTHLGSHYRTKTKHPLYYSGKDIRPHHRRARRTFEIHQGARIKRVHQTI